MERKIDIVFNSEMNRNERMFQIASGHISETVIYFEKEEIIAVVQAKGVAEIYNVNNELLASAEVSSPENGKKVYQDLCCGTDGDLIFLKFPIYEWIDNYPNCDGEYDRWDTRIVGWNTLTFNKSDNTFI